MAQVFSTPLPAAKLARRPGLLKDNALPLLAVGVSTLLLAIGWAIFADRLIMRSERASSASADEARLWGGPLLQPHPSVRWRPTTAATSALAAGELEQSQVVVGLDAVYRQRGLIEFPCFEADFSGSYAFTNPSEQEVFVAFSVGLPVKGDALMLRNLKLLVNGEERPAETEYTPEHIVWTGRLAGKGTAHFQLKYLARGLERFGYSLQAARACEGEGCGTSAIKPVTGFTLEMNVKGARGALDRATGWMAPTSEAPIPDGTRLQWSVDRLLTAQDLGVVLPDNRGLSVALAKLMDNAPVFYLMFAAGLLYALGSVPRRARALHVLGLSGGYFLYFPLATYLTVYLPWAVACAVAVVGITALAVLHAYRFISRTVGWQVGLCHLFFLAAPAGAYLQPHHTGLTLVIAGFLALAAGLQAVGTLAGRLREEEPVSPVPVPAMAGVAPEATP